MNLEAIAPINKREKTINVIIETPRNNKYKIGFDERLQVFKIKKILPQGTFFPFDFGFIPNTKGGDGDPLDVLVIADEQLFTGCLVTCRIVGLLEATQQYGKEKKERNDRIVAIAESSIMYSGVK